MTSCTVAIILSILIFVMFALNKLTPGTISLLGALALTVLIPGITEERLLRLRLQRHPHGGGHEHRQRRAL